VPFGFDPQTMDVDRTELADAVSKIEGGGSAKVALSYVR
jgi:hypothetical protein